MRYGIGLLLAASLYGQATSTFPNIVVSPGFRSRAILFANLGTLPTTDGLVVYCSDCSATTPVSGGGLGTMVARTNGSWQPLSGGGGGGVAPYTANVTAQTSLTVTLATHMQGSIVIPACWTGPNSTGTQVSCEVSNAAGDITFTWAPAFTGSVEIRGNGAGSAPPYTADVTAQSTLSVPLATHMQGTAVTTACWTGSNATGTQVACSVSNVAGDITFTWLPPFTGSIEIRGSS